MTSDCIYNKKFELFYLQISGKRAKADLAVVVQRRAAFCNGDGRGQPDSNVFSDVARRPTLLRLVLFLNEANYVL